MKSIYLWEKINRTTGLPVDLKTWKASNCQKLSRGKCVMQSEKGSPNGARMLVQDPPRSGASPESCLPRTWFLRLSLISLLLISVIRRLIHCSQMKILQLYNVFLLYFKKMSRIKIHRLWMNTLLSIKTSSSDSYSDQPQALMNFNIKIQQSK